jgi:mannose-6-phosphate isomerase-like protein (cupin superfamily)
MRDRMLAGTLVLALLSGTAAAQGPTNATDVTKAEIDAVFATLDGGIDKQVKVVDIGQDTNVAVGILHRAEMQSEAGQVRAIVHHKVTEVYYIISGSGTLVTGGPLADSRDFPADSGVTTTLVGPSGSGLFEAGVSRPVAPGDVVVIPGGVPHGFSHIEEAITYLSIRVDPDQVLPAGYVNPAIQ